MEFIVNRIKVLGGKGFLATRKIRSQRNLVIGYDHVRSLESGVLYSVSFVHWQTDFPTTAPLEDGKHTSAYPVYIMKRPLSHSTNVL